MPFDGSVIAAVSQELRPIIIGSRIDKIFQPEPDELIMTMRHQRNNFRLLLSAHNQYPRVHLTTASRDNPSQPPVFCMLLRKHLAGGKVVHIEQPDFERILVIHVQGTDELNRQTHKKLIVEMMGKHSNIILVDTVNNQILDAVKRIPLHISRKRQVLPGLPYESPPSEKRSPLFIDSAPALTDVMNAHSQQNLKNALISAFNGFSPSLCQEVVHRAGLESDHRWDDLTPSEQDHFFDAFQQIHQMIIQETFYPCLYRHSDTGRYIDFSVIPLSHLTQVESVPFPTVSELLESFYGHKDHYERLQQRSQDLRKTLTVKRNRFTHKLQNLHHDEEKAIRSSVDKLKADLIMANIHQIQSGQSTINVTNYFDENQPLVEITLDSRKSPSQNAQMLYKRYQKSKTALVEIARQRQKTLLEIQYLDQVFHSLEQADSLHDLEMIREELIESGYLKKKTLRKKQSRPKTESKPLAFRSSKNHLIRVGKNNIQNEMVTFKLGKKNDLWFHVKDLPGSHVVLSLENQAPVSEEIKQSALLAAYYSKGRGSSNVPVDYTWCRHVKKQRGGRPGMVTYTNHQTVFVTPNKDSLEQIFHVEEKNSR
ncbi:MAG: NFACT RNA binding domain-containing protein [Bacillota bacterium]|nr:NFACT RNA binding domain-containing protein [Bacillota bacterium]MDW7676448.1 NFACT RNA binding domain-containing protein [Bacillota bacterium]